MKFLFSLLCLTLLCCTACEKEEAKLLNNLAGTYQVTEVSLIAAAGQDSVFTPNLLLSFSDCDLSTNMAGGNCSLQVSGDTTFPLQYGVERSGASDAPRLNITPAAGSDGATATVAYQVINGIFSYELTDGELTMTANASDRFPHNINGTNYLIKQIVARQQ